MDGEDIMRSAGPHGHEVTDWVDTGARGTGIRTAPLVFGMTGAVGLPGGIARSNLNVLCAMVDISRDTGRSLHVVSLHEEPVHRPGILPENASFTGCRGQKWHYARSLWCLGHSETFYLFDHVHLAMPMLPHMLLGIGKVVILAHGSESWRRVRPTSKLLYRKADLCLTNSYYTLRRMRETFGGFRALDCQLGLPPGTTLTGEMKENRDASEFLQSIDGEVRRLGERMLLLVGRMDSREREKGHYALLDAWPRIFARYPDAQLVFAGPGDDRERISSRAEELGLSASVFVPGYLDERALHGLYARCHAFVMPSRQEGFGLVYLEAMSHAKACVGCRADGAEDVIVDGETGYLVNDPRDSLELSAVVSRLFDEPELTRHLGRQGLARLHSGFSSEQAQSRIRDRIRSILCSR